MTGTRHPMLAEYKVEVDKSTLKVEKYEVDFYANCDHSMDLPAGVMCKFLCCFCIKLVIIRPHALVGRQLLPHSIADDSRIFVQDEYSVEHRLSRLWRTAGHVRH